MSDQRDSRRETSPSLEERGTPAIRSASNGDRPSFDGPEHTPARSLLVHFGRWVGDDVEELLDEVHRTRGKARF
jgi:hypothetical protein